MDILMGKGRQLLKPVHWKALACFLRLKPNALYRKSQISDRKKGSQLLAAVFPLKTSVIYLGPYLLGFPNLSIKNPASTTTIAFLQKSYIRNTVLLEELHTA